MRSKMNYFSFKNHIQPTSLFSKKNLILIITITLLYYFSGRLGQVFALPPGYVTPVWPPSGIALAVVLLFGNRILPGIWLGSFLNNFLLNIEPLEMEFILKSFLTSIGIGAGATLQAYVGGYCIKEYSNVEFLNSPVNVFKFILIGILSSTLQNFLKKFANFEGIN